MISRPACALLIALLGTVAAAADRTVTIGNDLVRRTLRLTDGAWRTVAFSRHDGTDTLAVDSDEFHILLFDNRAVTIRDYQVSGDPQLYTEGSERLLVVRYVKRADASLPEAAPAEVTITYSAGNDFFLRKTVDLVVPAEQTKKIDRLEVERFSTSVKATRGGRGQPVFLDNRWFVGLEHPSARMRHTDGNTPVDYQEPWGDYGAWFYKHSVQGRDIDTNARPGLVRCMHFPSYPARGADGTFRLTSKSAVVGTARPGETLELGFLDYIRTLSRPAKRLSHYNNWYDGTGKDLAISNFADRVLATYNDYFAPYGVRVDSMVSDNFNWHTDKSIYRPNPRHFPNGDADMRKLNDALRERNSNLGLWLTLSGNNGISPSWATNNGYQWGPGGHFLLASPTNRAAMKQRLKELITNVGVNYFKHDFNTLKSKAENGHAPDERHGHEAEVDAMFELLDWEYACNPEIFVNVTSGVWFSPWLLARCNTIWMLAHDDGAGESGPEPSNFLHQQSYRDEVIYVPWGQPASRPLLPVSQLMTHGIICGPHSVGRKYNNIREDSLEGWASGVMLYYMRGTLLQEWYITPQDLSRPQWDALGRTSRWFKEHEKTLANAVFWGGDPAQGEPFGYAAWNGERGIVSMRNSQPVPRKVAIPFDQTVWYRGQTGVTFRADVVFPWHNEWPQAFTSGCPMQVTVPPYTVLVMHLEPGAMRGGTPGTVLPALVKPVVQAEGGAFKQIALNVPARAMTNCELMVTAYGTNWPVIHIDGAPARRTRESWSTSWRGATDKWRTRCFDLLPHQGKRVTAAVTLDPPAAHDVRLDILMIQDLVVAEPPDTGDVRLPLPVSQGSRRAVSILCEKTALKPQLLVEPEG